MLAIDCLLWVLKSWGLFWLPTNLSLVAMNEQWIIRSVEHHAENLEDCFDRDHGVGVLVCWNLDP